jgi:hypothetical protein
MHPNIRKTVAHAGGLGDLILMVGELEIIPAAVDIERLAQGDSHPGKSSLEGFHKTKSIGSSLKGATSTRAPAIMSSTERPDKAP